MQQSTLLKKLNVELSFNRLGPYRKFKFVNDHLDDEQKTINFFTDVLGYKLWEVNKIRYNIQYFKIRYQNQKSILRQ